MNETDGGQDDDGARRYDGDHIEIPGGTFYGAVVGKEEHHHHYPRPRLMVGAISGVLVLFIGLFVWLGPGSSGEPTPSPSTGPATTPAPSETVSRDSDVDVACRSAPRQLADGELPIFLPGDWATAAECELGDGDVDIDGDKNVDLRYDGSVFTAKGSAKFFGTPVKEHPSVDTCMAFKTADEERGNGPNASARVGLDMYQCLLTTSGRLAMVRPKSDTAVTVSVSHGAVF